MNLFTRKIIEILRGRRVRATDKNFANIFVGWATEVDRLKPRIGNSKVSYSEVAPAFDKPWQ